MTTDQTARVPTALVSRFSLSRRSERLSQKALRERVTRLEAAADEPAAGVSAQDLEFSGQLRGLGHGATWLVALGLPIVANEVGLDAVTTASSAVVTTLFGASSSYAVESWHDRRQRSFEVGEGNPIGVGKFDKPAYNAAIRDMARRAELDTVSFDAAIAEIEATMVLRSRRSVARIDRPTVRFQHPVQRPTTFEIE